MHKGIVILMIFNMDQAAERLGVSRRWLQGFLSTNPTDKGGTPFYTQLGNRKKFTEQDIERILTFNREQVRCLLNHPAAQGLLAILLWSRDLPQAVR